MGSREREVEIHRHHFRTNSDGTCWVKRARCGRHSTLLPRSLLPGLLLSRCTRHQWVYEVRSIWSIHLLEAAVAAVNAASSRKAAAAAAAAGEAMGSSAVSVSFESHGEFPTALMLQQRWH